MGTSLTALRVRDRQLIKLAVLQSYPQRTTKMASVLPEPELVIATVEALWLPKPGVNSKQAFLGITKAVSKILDLLKKAPQAWKALQQTLEIEGWDEMNLTQKAKALGSRLRDLVHEGQAVLGKVFKHMTTEFPLSLFFVPHKKMPGLTDLLHRIMQANPAIQKALEHIGAGAVHVDKFLEKYVPTLRKPVYAAIFIWVWLNASEISWDLQGIIAGFTGQVSLSELLASMPESGLGVIAASFGLGYGALPYALIARLLWLVAQNYISYLPGKGFQVHWGKMNIRQRDEVVPA